MKKYKYAIVEKWAFNDVMIRCTDTKSLNDILAKLQEIRPDIQIKPFEKDMVEEPYSIIIEQKGKNKIDQEKIKWWFVKQMCNSGWQPLGEGRYVFEED